jgi:hypothetical protein
VGQLLGGNKCDCFVVEKMWPPVDGGIDLSRGIGSGEDADSFCFLEIFT